MPRDPEKQRAAKRRYYERNKQVYLDKNARKRERMRAYLRSLKEAPCMDCGQKFPYWVMDFDHLEGKESLIGRLVFSLSWKRLEAELEKCELVCANCHRVRTWDKQWKFQRRNGVGTLDPTLPGRSIGRSPRSGRGGSRFKSLPGSEQLRLFPSEN